MSHARKIAVIGLGYVGLAVAAAFARAGSPVIEFDINTHTVRELRAGQDRTCEVETAKLKRVTLELTCDEAVPEGADFFIVTMPTPIDAANRPDLSMFEDPRTVGMVFKGGDVVVYESMVHPSREEDWVPKLECASGLIACADFDVGYSPERIISGDKKLRFETITKVISAQNARTLNIVADVDGSLVPSGIHGAPSTKVAEAANIIENTQRDLKMKLDRGAKPSAIDLWRS